MSKTPAALAAEYKREHTEYLLTWSNGNTQTVIGVKAAAAMLGIKRGTLGVYISTGRAHAGLWRTYPETGEPMQVRVTVGKMTQQTPMLGAGITPFAKRRQGRPAKDTGVDEPEKHTPNLWDVEKIRARKAAQAAALKDKEPK